MTDTVTVSHIEVIQSIQDIDNTVVLIKRKKTYARVYIGIIESDLEQEYVVSGKLKFSQADERSDPGHEESINAITLKTNESQNLDKQRLSWDLSLNFEITDAIKYVDAALSLELVKIKLNSPTSGESRTVVPIGEKDCEIPNTQIFGSSRLYCTALVFRYWDTGIQQYVEPAPERVDLIRQFVVSSFPFAESFIEWNTVHVMAIDEFRALNKVGDYREDQNEEVSKELRELLLQTILHRNQDLSADGADSCRDIRTLYLGVFDDPSGRLGGAAIDSPAFAAHNIVGVTVADLNGQTGAHELAHMLGRKHPGVPDRKRFGPQIGQHKEDKSAEVPEHGFLSNKKDRCIGLHRDPRSTDPKIYEYNLWFDLMTYRLPQWISRYTYEGIRDRLGKLFSNTNKSSFKVKSEYNWLVIGEYDLGRNTGKILYVLPTSYKVSEIEDSQIRIKCNYKNDTTKEVYVQHRLDTQQDMPAFGIFQANIFTENLKDIVLRIEDSDVDKYAMLEEPLSTELSGLGDRFDDILDNPGGNSKKPTSIENGWQYLEDTSTLMVFTYSVEDDEYWLRFKWKKFNIQVVTTIQCKKPLEKSCWETVLVTTRRKGKAWISPTFVEKYYSSDDLIDGKCNTPPYSFGVKNYRPVRDRANDKLTFRVVIVAGFEKFPSSIHTVSPFIEFPRMGLRNKAERDAYIRNLSQDEQERYKKQPNRPGRFRSLRD